MLLLLACLASSVPGVWAWGPESLLSDSWMKQELVVHSDPYLSWSSVLGKKEPCVHVLLEACEETLPGICFFQLMEENPLLCRASPSRTDGMWVPAQTGTGILSPSYVQVGTCGKGNME